MSRKDCDQRDSCPIKPEDCYGNIRCLSFMPVTTPIVCSLCKVDLTHAVRVLGKEVIDQIHSFVHARENYVKKLNEISTRLGDHIEGSEFQERGLIEIKGILDNLIKDMG